MKPNFIRKNWYGFDHGAVNTQFEGGLTFLNSFCIKDEYAPVTIYKAAKPNKEKKHKKYFLIQIQEKKGLIRGMTPSEMEKERYRMSIHCFLCNDLIFSASRHDYCQCSCKNVTIDGGKDYTKTSWVKNNSYQMMLIDLLTGKPKLNVKEKHAKKFNKKLKGIINEQ